MWKCKILLKNNHQYRSSKEISSLIEEFSLGYNNAVGQIIQESMELENYGDTFISCASRILRSFGMTRSGTFHYDMLGRLRECWTEIGKELLEIRSEISGSEISRERFIIDCDASQREQTISRVWNMTKTILPITMGENSYGLVGASKILFSILPEVVLPVDNVQWKQLFKTVDLGDVIRFMVDDIQEWETVTKKEFHLLDKSGRLTTLPSLYNVVAMVSRPKSV